RRCALRVTGSVTRVSLVAVAARICAARVSNCTLWSLSGPQAGRPSAGGPVHPPSPPPGRGQGGRAGRPPAAQGWCRTQWPPRSLALDAAVQQVQGGARWRRARRNGRRPVALVVDDDTGGSKRSQRHLGTGSDRDVVPTGELEAVSDVAGSAA